MHALWLHNSHDHFGDSRARLYPASGPGKGRIYESNGMHHSCSRLRLLYIYVLSVCPMVSILFQSNLIQPNLIQRLEILLWYVHGVMRARVYIMAVPDSE